MITAARSTSFVVVLGCAQGGNGDSDVAPRTYLPADPPDTYDTPTPPDPTDPTPATVATITVDNQTGEDLTHFEFCENGYCIFAVTTFGDQETLALELPIAVDFGIAVTADDRCAASALAVPLGGTYTWTITDLPGEYVVTDAQGTCF